MSGSGAAKGGGLASRGAWSGRGPRSPEKKGGRTGEAGRRLLRWLAGLGLAMAFIGVNLQWLTHITGARWLGVALIIAGLALACYVVWRSGPREEAGRSDIAYRLIRRATLGGRLTPLMPLLGAAVISVDLVWNLIVARSTVFLSQDWTLWALAGVLVAYPLVPPAYGRERDFALILTAVFTLTMVAPMGVYRAATGTIELPGGFVEALLGGPTAWILGLAGVDARAHGIYITFQMASGRMESLGISTACAGLDSLFLFISGFVAFILVESPQIDLRIGAALVAGVLTAYLANLLRMTLIVLAGVYWGREAMLAVHENAGTLIFLGWIALFWYLMYRLVLRPARRGPSSSEGEGRAPERGQRRGAMKGR